jgi:polysaccharide deacetylase 2 family uncharacterized protein YibQ
LTISHEELTRPLGLEPATRRRRLPVLPWGQIVVAGSGLMFLALAGWLAVARDPDGGEPVVISRIERSKAPPPPAVTPAQPDTGVRTVTGEDQNAPERSTAAELESASGVKVVRGSGEAPPSIVIRVPGNPDKLAPAPDKRLVERSRQGLLPKIGPDGARPLEVYARPVTPPAGKVTGRIAVVIGGMGLSQSLTSDAVAKLPGAVTLAFAPYGTDIERQVGRAREDGHEVLLQVPMEPFDYPDNDPGPHTLTATASAPETLDRLQWVMSRFPGYVGIVNYMGGKFTAREASVSPVLREVAGRGLMVLDDGSSARSLVPSLGQSLKMPVAKADVTVDSVPKATTIDDQLARLEAIAREKGTAVGMASGLPVSIDRIAAWAKGLEARGFQLVPVSAIVARADRG